MIWIEKLAFKAGSSKHGKANRASVDSNCVVAKYLKYGVFEKEKYFP